MYADVVINDPHLAAAYSYAIPAEMEGRLAPGHLVTVPLRGRRTQGIISPDGRCHQFCLRNRQLFRIQLRPIESLRKFQQSRVSSRLHLVQDRPCPLLYLRVKKTGSGRQFGDLLGKIGIRLAKHSHCSRKLVDTSGKVKDSENGKS